VPAQTLGNQQLTSNTSDSLVCAKLVGRRNFYLQKKVATRITCAYTFTMNSNPFDKLDAQNPSHAFAHFTPEEHAEYQRYLDEMAQQAQDNGKLSAFVHFLGEQSSRMHEMLAPQLPPEAEDHTPDPFYDGEAYECDADAPYDGGGWPGDGSGTDDLADLMAHGDEGCCDGPND